MHKNIEVEIYLNNIINFFEKNPNDLLALIGETDIENFYEEIKIKAYENYAETKEAELTKKQLIEIVVRLTTNKKIDKTFISTKIGQICLN